jgi:hypothetical protein
MAVVKLVIASLLCVGAILANPTAAPPAETSAVVRTKPASEWGSYYYLNHDAMFDVFKDVFVQMRVKNPSATKCTSTAYTSALYSRYYQNIDPQKSNQYILSYYCYTSRGFEHIRATINDISSKKGLFVSFHNKLSELGISGAGDYQDDTTRTDDDSKKFVENLFNSVKDSIPADCPNPGFSTSFQVQFKTENELSYWKFPVACSVQSPDDMFTDVEVFQDNINNWVNDGKLTFVGLYGLSSNQKYHIDRAAEIARQQKAAEDARIAEEERLAREKALEEERLRAEEERLANEKAGAESGQQKDGAAQVHAMGAAILTCFVAIRQFVM